jgi:hypothetical protein
MTKPADAVKAWDAAFKSACKEHKMQFVSGVGFIVDDLYIASLNTMVSRSGKDQLQVSWTIEIKPMAVDDFLWEAFLPDVEMGARMRINRRINGAFRVWSLPLDGGRRLVPTTSQPDWSAELDQFSRIRAEFIAQYPTAAGFVAAVRAHSDAEQRPSVNVVREITALLAAGLNGEAADVADAAITRGEHGNMSSETDVTKYLSAYAKGPEAYSDFMASLVPTHVIRRISSEQPPWSTTLMRAHHQGRFAQELNELDGTHRFAFVLDVRPPESAEVDHTAVRYLQAAGSAESMLIEIRQPGGTDGDAVSVRSVLGHPDEDPELQDVAVTPHLKESVFHNEVFTADEAGDIFTAYYRDDALPDGYTLRPVEGYTATGEILRY